MLVRFPGTPFLRQEISRATVEKRHPRDDCMRHRLWSSGVTAHCWTSPYTGDKTWHAARREEKAPGWPIRRSSPQKRKRAGRPSTSTPFLERCPQSIGLVGTEGTVRSTPGRFDWKVHDAFARVPSPARVSISSRALLQRLPQNVLTHALRRLTSRSPACLPTIPRKECRYG